LETNKISYLLFHLIIGGLLIQFQLAIGIPYLALSSILVVYHALKNKNRAHLLAFMIIPLCLANFFVFELRHDFTLTKGVRFFLLAHEREKEVSYLTMAKDDIRLILTGAEILRTDPLNVKIDLRLLISIIFAIFIWRQIKDNIHKRKCWIFLYLYLGFFLLSFANKGFILYFYLHPQFSLVFLLFASMSTSNYKKIFIPIFLTIFVLNFYTAIDDTRDSKSFIGKNGESWKFLHNLSKKIYQEPENSFGYFIYTPDAFGYQLKYAMIYTASLFNKQSFSFEKKPITYIIAEPHQFMKDKWWKENQINIIGEPEASILFENGYKVEKYQLDEEQINVPFDPSINPGIHFR